MIFARPYHQVTFVSIDRKTYLEYPTPPVFFVSRVILEEGNVELRPLNPWSFTIAFSKNCWRYQYWRFCGCLYKCGFLDPPPNQMLVWRRHFRLAFWRARQHYD